MPHQQSEIPNLLRPPNTETCVEAISRGFLSVRNSGWPVADLAKELGCSKDVVRAASNGDNLVSFDTIVKLCFKFPDHTGIIRELFRLEGGAAPTLHQRLERAERELAAIRREVPA